MRPPRPVGDDLVINRLIQLSDILLRLARTPGLAERIERARIEHAAREAEVYDDPERTAGDIQRVRNGGELLARLSEDQLIRFASVASRVATFETDGLHLEALG